MESLEKSKRELLAELEALRAEVERLRARPEGGADESEERFLKIFEEGPLGMALVGADRRILRANPALCAMLGYTAEELQGKTFMEITHPEYIEEDVRQVERLFKGEIASYRLEKCYIRKDGAVIWGNLTASVVRNRQGEVLYALGIVEDVTEHRRLRERLARAQRLETAGQVAGQIAHDFNNLLAPLTAYPYIIREELPPDHPAQEMLEEMASAAQEIAEINQQLLALGRRGHYSTKPVDVNALIQKVIMSREWPSGVTVRQELVADLLPVKGGAAQLTRAFINLFNNAVEAMQGRGTLTVATAMEEVHSRAQGALEPGQYVRVEINDTGVGIKPEVLERIFDPFFTTKAMDRMRGSGLGLSVVDGIVKDHGGTIVVDSRPGEGTTFRLYFPVTTEVSHHRLQEVEEVKRGRQERILLIDDDAVQRKVAGHILRRLGYQVREASSGEEALGLVQKAPADLVIIDMVMEGMDGAETFGRLLEIRPEQKAIILSGYAMSERVHAALRLGAETFLSKPITPNSLATAVRKALDK